MGRDPSGRVAQAEEAALVVVGPGLPDMNEQTTRSLVYVSNGGMQPTQPMLEPTVDFFLFYI